MNKNKNTMKIRILQINIQRGSLNFRNSETLLKDIKLLSPVHRVSPLTLLCRCVWNWISEVTDETHKGFQWAEGEQSSPHPLTPVLGLLSLTPWVREWHSDICGVANLTLIHRQSLNSETELLLAHVETCQTSLRTWREKSQVSDFG